MVPSSNLVSNLLRQGGDSPKLSQLFRQLDVTSLFVSIPVVCQYRKFTPLFVCFLFFSYRYQSLTISIWTWTGSFISAPIQTTRMSIFASRRRRFSLTSSTMWRFSFGSSSRARCFSWRWMVWHPGQRWTNREDGDLGRPRLFCQCLWSSRANPGRHKLRGAINA